MIDTCRDSLSHDSGVASAEATAVPSGGPVTAVPAASDSCRRHLETAVPGLGVGQPSDTRLWVRRKRDLLSTLRPPTRTPSEVRARHLG